MGPRWTKYPLKAIHSLQSSIAIHRRQTPEAAASLTLNVLLVNIQVDINVDSVLLWFWRPVQCSWVGAPHHAPLCMNQDFISMPVTQTSPTSISAQSPLGLMLSAGCGSPATIHVANGLHFSGLVLMSLGTFAALLCIVLMYTACRSAVGHLLDRGLRVQTTNNNNSSSMFIAGRALWQGSIAQVPIKLTGPCWRLDYT